LSSQWFRKSSYKVKSSIHDHRFTSLTLSLETIKPKTQPVVKEQLPFEIIELDVITRRRDKIRAKIERLVAKLFMLRKSKSAGELSFPYPLLDSTL